MSDTKDLLDHSVGRLSYKFGNHAPFHFKVLGGFIIIVGLGMITSLIAVSMFIGGMFILVGLRMCATVHGIDIDVGRNRHREYMAYAYLIKFGKWQSIENYPYLSILMTKAGAKIDHWAGTQTKYLDQVYDIHLLNETHRGKLFVKRCASMEEAEDEAAHIGHLLNKEVVTFAPKISAASMAKRNRARGRR